MAATVPARSGKERPAPRKRTGRRVRRLRRTRMPRFAVTAVTVGIGLLLAANGWLGPNLDGYLLALGTAVALDLFAARA